MTREETIAAIQVMQAYVDGAEIEVQQNAIEWRHNANPAWQWGSTQYRVKPKPKIELRVGAWYENDVGFVMKCHRFCSSYIYDRSDYYMPINKIIREVRVLPVSEGE